MVLAPSMLRSATTENGYQIAKITFIAADVVCVSEGLFR